MATTKRFTLNESIELANSIKDEIIKEYKKRDGFSDGERSGKGLIKNCAGIISLLLLKNGIEDKLQFNDDEITIIKKTFEDVINHLNKSGYDATPFISSETTEDYFKPNKGYYYYDSVSWVLSLMVQIWNANKLERGKLLSSDGKEIVKSTMKESLKIICEGAVEGGGWGFTNNCDKADLYFSYTISEALADFADYILGESEEEIGIKKDDEIIDFVSQELVNKVNNCRKKTAGWLVDTFIKKPKYKLGEILINPEDINGEKFKNLSDEKIFTLLYYTYFVIDMLIINKADEFFEQDKEAIKKALEHSIYLSRIYFDRARTIDEWWGNKASELIVDFKNNSKFPNPQKISNGEISEPGLAPLSLRCNILYSFYISKGQDKKIDELFEVLLKERNDKENKPKLWDTYAYNILITERAVEGLIDYIDFVKEYQIGISVFGKENTGASKDILSNKSIDELVRIYVAEEVREFFSTEIGKKLLIENSNSNKIPEGISKSMIVDLLLELFTDLEFYINPDKRSHLEPKDIEAIRDFTKKYTSWLQNLLYIELRETDINKDKNLVIYNNLKNQRNAFKSIADQLKESKDPQMFYEIILYTIEKYLSK